MSANVTYKSLAEGLPPDMAKQLHPDWYKNEAEYWAVRDSLLPLYEKQWIGFAGGKVVASGSRPVHVLHSAKQADPYAFFACVGREYEPYRVRRTAFAYDTQYQGEPLPVVSAEFRKGQGIPGIVLGQVIMDTGSDTSVLPLSDCQQLQLDLSQATATYVTGVGGTAMNTLQVTIWIVIDGAEYVCQLNVDKAGTERILGRDVLNYMDVLFRGPAAEVVINP
jgi:predicted aspartyl protease